MSALLDMVQMTTTTTGTGNVITLGPVVPGYQTFANAGATNGQSFSYGIIDQANTWEVGTANYISNSSGYFVTTPGTTRTPQFSSNNGGPISLSGGAQIYATFLNTDYNTFNPANSVNVAGGNVVVNSTGVWVGPYVSMLVSGSINTFSFVSNSSVVLGPSYANTFYANNFIAGSTNAGIMNSVGLFYGNSVTVQTVVNATGFSIGNTEGYFGQLSTSGFILTGVPGSIAANSLSVTYANMQFAQYVGGTLTFALRASPTGTSATDYSTNTTATLTADVCSIGNSTANSYVNTTTISVVNLNANTFINPGVITLANSTTLIALPASLTIENPSTGDYSNLSANQFYVGNSTVYSSINATSYITGLSVVNSVGFYTGNSTGYFQGNSTSLVLGTTTSNVVVNASTIIVGNNTINSTLANINSIVSGNTTINSTSINTVSIGVGNTIINSTTIATGLTTGNSSGFYVGNASVSILEANSTELFIQNPITNTQGYITANSIFLGNTTANISINSSSISTNTLILNTSNVSGNGYTYLPNKALMQWGSVEAVAANQESIANVTVTFPLAYTTNCYSVTLSSNYASIIPTVTTINATAFEIVPAILGLASNTMIYWQAIGA